MVKLFESNYAIDLENKINKWIKNNNLNIDIIDIKFSITIDDNKIYSALVIYKFIQN